jgi:alpha-tubulin suppressor-like RCC1 family protein
MLRSTVVVVVAVVSLAMAAAGCYQPEIGRCAISCLGSDTCPDGRTCGPDFYCHVPDDHESCASETIDSGVPGSDYVEISAGNAHTCAIDGAGTLWCWGYNRDAELGSTAPGERTGYPTAVSGPGWTHVAAGGAPTCAIRDGGMWCWGRGDYGQNGNEGLTTLEEPTEVGPDHDWIAVSAGDRFTCGIRGDPSGGRLYCWGDDAYHQLGDPGPDASGAAVREVGTTDGIDRFDDFVALDSGFIHSCALRSNGEAYCFGYGELGRLGTGSDANQDVPTAVTTGRYARIAAGGRATCAITSGDGTLWCWGSNDAGNLGHPGAPDLSNEPLQVGTLTGWSRVSVGDGGACAARDGSAYCWGPGSFGEIGNSRRDTQTVPTLVDGLSHVDALAAGNVYNCALSDGNAYCWGRDSDGQLGNGNWSTKWEPTRVGTMSGWDTVVAGRDHTCAVTVSNRLFCWGANRQQQLGYQGDDSPQPREIATPDQWLSVAVGDRHTCATRRSAIEELWCWGDNEYGQIGNGLGSQVFAPAQIDGTTAWDHLVASSYGNCAMTAGARRCWGEGTVLGNGHADVVRTPTEVGGETIQWEAFDFGASFGCGIDAGSLYCWGANDVAQQGRGPADGTVTLAPVMTGAISGDVTASYGDGAACAISGGTLRCWGNNEYGKLGLGTAGGTVETPTPVAGTGWMQVSAGLSHTCAINDSAQLFCWGSNIDAQLGDPALLYTATTPQRIGTTHDWALVSAGYLHTCAITTGDRDLYCWGTNTTGVIGDGSQAWPVPVRTFR